MKMQGDEYAGRRDHARFCLMYATGGHPLVAYIRTEALRKLRGIVSPLSNRLMILSSWYVRYLFRTKAGDRQFCWIRQRWDDLYFGSPQGTTTIEGAVGEIDEAVLWQIVINEGSLPSRTPP